MRTNHIFLWVLTLLLIAICSLKAQNRSFYIYANQTFTTEQTATIQYYDYTYSRQSRNLRVVAYKIKNAKNFFMQYLKQPNQYQHLPQDSLLKESTVAYNQVHSLSNSYYTNFNLGKLSAGLYMVEVIDRGQVAQVPLFVSDWGIMTQKIGDNLVAYTVNKKTGKAIPNIKTIMTKGARVLEPRSYENGIAYFNFGGSEVAQQYYYQAPMEKENAYTLSLWLQAAVLAKDKAMQEKLLTMLVEKVQKTGAGHYWGGKKFYYSWQDDQVETTANAIKAIYMAKPNHEVLPLAIRWLMSKREGEAWHNTRQTAMSIYALNDFIKQEINA